jgi:hypothetical protein
MGCGTGKKFIAAGDEAELIRRIGDLPLQPFQFGAFEGKRRVAMSGLAPVATG